MYVCTVLFSIQTHTNAENLDFMSFLSRFFCLPRGGRDPTERIAHITRPNTTQAVPGYLPGGFMDHRCVTSVCLVQPEATTAYRTAVRWQIYKHVFCFFNTCCCAKQSATDCCDRHLLKDKGKADAGGDADYRSSVSGRDESPAS